MSMIKHISVQDYEDKWREREREEEKEMVDKKERELEREITCSKGSSVSSVEGGIRHERRILYSRS